MITDVKYLESQFSDELAEELDKSSKDDDTNVDAVIAEIMNRGAIAFANTFDIGRDLINEVFALQEKGDNINYEHPMGHKVNTRYGVEAEILSGDAIDVEVKNTLETFDSKKHKLLLESANIVKDYNDFVQCHFEKNITGRSGENGTPSYSVYFKYFEEGISGMSDSESESDIKKCILGEYHQTDDPEIIRKIVQMRIKYIEGVNAILKEMLKTNGQLLGLNEQQIDALIKGLSNDETSGKTVGEIKEIILKNRDKFIKQDNTVLDMRSLGAGVYVGAGDDMDHFLSSDDKIKTVIQQCLTYDLVLNAHGISQNIFDLAKIDPEYETMLKDITKELKMLLPKIGRLGVYLKEGNKTKYLDKLASAIIEIIYDNEGSPMPYDEFRNEIDDTLGFLDNNTLRKFDNNYEEDIEQLNKRLYLLYKKYAAKNRTPYELKKKWQFQIRYLDGKVYNNVKDVIKMAKTNGFNKILINSCNPQGLDLPKDLTKNVTFGKHSIFKESYTYTETYDEDNIYEFLNDFENDYRAIAESYNIDYDNDQVLNEMYNYVISGQYLAETATIHEGKLADIWHKIIEFIKKAIGFIIKLVKMFIGWIKGIIDKIKERFGKKKKVKINKSPVKASFISVEGNNASLTSEKEVSSYNELKELINKVIEAITKVFRKNSDEQVRLQNSLKNECERAANKQSSIGESYLINEAMLKSAKDIYHNKDKFKSGEANLCFITGLSGSGKSSMGTAMVKGAKNIEHYDMDDIVFNKQNHDMNYYKNYGDLVYKFFSGPGKKYFVTFKEIKSSLNTSEDKYREEITNAFVDFAISYAKSHKNTKFIIEGVWLYRYISPSKFKDYAVCIKGTSAATSMMRAAKRDNDYLGKFKKGTVWVGDEMKLNKYRAFYKDSAEEQDNETELKESRTLFGSVDNMDLMYMSCYESYLYNIIDNEAKLTEALINECGLNESTILLEADLKTDIRSKWEIFINFVNRMVDRFNVAMGKILYDKTKYLEANKDVILGTQWRDDISYSYEGDYDVAVDRCMNTKCPVFNYERDATPLRQDGYEKAIEVFMAGAGFKYNVDPNVKLESQFKDYFLAKDHGKKEGKLSDLKPQKLYDFCHNYDKIKKIIDADNASLRESTNIIINAINKEMRERGEDPNKQSNTNSQTDTTGQGGSTADNNKSDANTAPKTDSSSQTENASFLWITEEVDGEQQSPTGNPSQTANDQNNGNDNKSSSGTGLKISNNSPAANDKDANNGTPTKTDTTQQDINNLFTKWRNMCRCLITAKLTAFQQISRDYMSFITAHVNSVSSKPTNADNKKDNNQSQEKQNPPAEGQ